MRDIIAAIIAGLAFALIYLFGGLLFYVLAGALGDDTAAVVLFIVTGIVVSAWYCLTEDA